jgi:hypothetical protein
MSTSRYRQGERLAGVIYVHRISDVRFTGTAVRSFKTLLAMCGNQALPNVVILTNMWGKVTPEVGAAREQELAGDFFKPALDNGARFRSHNDTAESAHDSIRAILDNQRVALQIQQEIVDQGKPVSETAAGKELRREFDEQFRKHVEQLLELQEMLNQTEEDDRESRQELEEEVSKLREELATMSRMSSHPAMGNFREMMENGVLFAVAYAAWMVFSVVLTSG